MAEQTGRSLSLTTEQQAKADIALSKFGSKRDLAADLEMSPTTITNFFAGRPVQRKQFHAICKKLKLDWQPEPAKQQQSQPEPSNVDELVREMRESIQPLIQEKCGTMRVLDMNQSIAMGEIYTHVNILEKISRRTRRELAELMPNVSPEAVERFGLGAVREQRIPGLEAVEKYDKLMILGKPGAGKTTFLKHLAIECSSGGFQSHRVPLFITLKEFAETEGQPDLLAYCDLWVNPRSPGHTSTAMLPILDNGRALILLDGLDEVRESDASRVLRQIQHFSERYSRNAFIITCRIAAREYIFQQFTDVEVADFDDDQIALFACKWFSKKNSVKANDFLQKLNAKPPIRKLATSPLLLSLLCLIFEDSEDFPAKRSNIYEQGIEQLLRNWNPHERERCHFYKELSPDYRQSLLQFIAAKTFENGNYFFKQQEGGKLIKEYIEGLGCFTPRELLKLDPKTTLETIEAQHGLLIERFSGIYSFSHLSFHEYFITLEIVGNSSLESLQQLATHITETRWREVFLLTVEMLPNADALLWQMKQAIDGMVAGDKCIQSFLAWVQQEASTVESSYNALAVRAFYINSDVGLSLKLDSNFSIDYEFAVGFLDSIVFDLGHDFDDYQSAKDRAIAEHIRGSITFAIARSLIFDLDIHDGLQKINNLRFLVDWHGCESGSFSQDWQDKSSEQTWEELLEIWRQDLCNVIDEYEDAIHDWEFEDEQQGKLSQYYAANEMLVDCLNSDCYVSREVRQEIEDTLLLPVAEIEQRRTHTKTSEV